MRLGRVGDIAALRLRSLFQTGTVNRELDRELQFHLEQLARENIENGMTPRAARQAALRSFGGVAQIEEQCKEMRRTRYIEDFVQDLRYSLRSLRRTPGFTAVMIATLALSIGANSAIFSLIEGVLVRALPYRQPEKLTRIFYSNPNWPKFPMNPFDFRDFRERSHSFESIAAYTRNDFELSGSGEPVQLTGFRVTAGFFHTLGLVPALGREFTTQDELPGGAPVAILSDRAWRERFAAAPDIVGRKIVLQRVAYTVAGVMPPGVEHPGNSYNPVAYGETVDVWTPFTFDGEPNQRGSHYVEGIARLKGGVTPAQAQSELNTVMAGLAKEHSGDVGWRIFLVPLDREIVGSNRRVLLVLLGAVGLVLLIACANAANLLLARATARQREIAMRMALGASKMRLIRQMLAESLLLSILGGALGALLAIAGVRALVHELPAGFPRASEIHVNGAVFAFTLIISVATGLLFGLAPALHASRSTPQHGLADAGRGATSGTHSASLRNILVVSEVGLASVLLIGSGLMLHSLLNLLRCEPGFRPEHVLTASISLPRKGYSQEGSAVLFYENLIRELNTLPGVDAAGGGTDLPWTGYDDNTGGFLVEGRQPPPHAEFHARYHVATPGYFRAVGIPLIRGRDIDGRDIKGSSKVLVINQAMARECWPNEDPVGRRLAFDDHPKEKDWFTVAGVVGDVKDKPENAQAEPAFWWPQSQTGFLSLKLAVRARTDTAILAQQLGRIVHRMDPALAVAEVRSMDAVAEDAFSTPRFALFLVLLFAALALAMASIGIYGVISYSVNLRRQEFAVRVAMGARPWHVMRLVMGQGVRLAAIGAAIGLGCGLALGRALASILYEVSGADLPTLAGSAGVALAMAALACYLPARRVLARDPMRSLQAE